MILPVNNQIILKWEDESKKDLKKKMDALGLALPENAQGESRIVQMGEILAVSESQWWAFWRKSGCKDRNGRYMSIKPGDKVLFATFHPFEMEINGERAYSLPASEIVAILDDGQA